jgi:hypothetical protein
MGIRTDMMSVGEAPVAGFDCEALPNVVPDDVEAQRERGFVASGLGWALDGSTGRFVFALPAMTTAIGLIAFEVPVLLAASAIASASGLVGGTLAPRFGRMRVPMCVIRRYSLFDFAPTAGARKGAR